MGQTRIAPELVGQCPTVMRAFHDGFTHRDLSQWNKCESCATCAHLTFAHRGVTVDPLTDLLITPSLITELCRKVAESTINRCICFTDQPQRTNSEASQSSSSGCDGFPPLRPKSLGVSTRPLPKWPCQMRFTMTRAVSGFSGLAIQSASVRRRSCSAESRASCFVPSTLNTAGTTSSFGCSGSPRCRR